MATQTVSTPVASIVPLPLNDPTDVLADQLRGIDLADTEPTPLEADASSVVVPGDDIPKVVVDDTKKAADDAEESPDTADDDADAGTTDTAAAAAVFVRAGVFDFLHLPRELRDQIYRELAAEIAGSACLQDDNFVTSWPDFAPITGVLQTCRQTHHELTKWVHDLVYRSGFFTVQTRPSGLRWFKRVRNGHLITKLRLGFCEQHPLLDADAAVLLLPTVLPNLEEFHINIERSVDHGGLWSWMDTIGEDIQPNRLRHQNPIEQADGDRMLFSKRLLVVLKQLPRLRLIKLLGKRDRRWCRSVCKELGIRVEQGPDEDSYNVFEPHMPLQVFEPNRLGREEVEPIVLEGVDLAVPWNYWRGYLIYQDTD